MVKSDSCFLKQFDNKLSIKNKNTMKEKKSKKNQRRGFLKRAALVSAALAVPSGFSEVFASETEQVETSDN